MNIRHRVRHIRQTNLSDCWHACLQMIYGRRGVPALGSPVYAPFLLPNGSLNPNEDNIRNFASQFGFVKQPHKVYSVLELQNHLQTSPVIILGRWYAGLHAYIMSGLTGDGSNNGTYVVLNNPSERGTMDYLYGFFIEQYQNGPFAILKPIRWRGR